MWGCPRTAAALAVLTGVFVASTASAVPGPDSVVVVFDASSPESAALAERYRAARAVPERQVCGVDLPDGDTVALDVFRSGLLEPLRACLDAGGVTERIEAAVLIRGLPIRVEIPDASATRRVSVAAALGVWASTIGDVPILGDAPGREVSCGGSPCYAARWTNPFQAGVFEPGWTREIGTVTWRPLLVTMLHGRSFEDAARLVDSAIAAEASGAPPAGELLLMDGADPARGVLDVEYDAVLAALAGRGITTASRVGFDANLTGRTLAAFFTGTASLGETIEGNTFAPGSIADNVTSFGAVPQNFEATGESQVSIARWVAMGVAGVHGTTDEPLNNVFPSRRLLVDYVDGSTLAEAFHRRLPYVYWHNLVLGDAMAAPYATRPLVAIEGVSDGESLASARAIVVTASDASGIGIASLRLFVDGVLVASGTSDRLEHCLAVPDGGDVQLLAVAQLGDDPTGVRPYRAKGWTELRVAASGATGECAADVDAGMTRDAGTPGDAGMPAADAGTAMPRRSDEGCGCRVAPTAPPAGGARTLLALSAIALLAARARVSSRARRRDQGPSVASGTRRVAPTAPMPRFPSTSRPKQ